MPLKTGQTVLATVATEIWSGRILNPGVKSFVVYSQGPATLTHGVIEMGRTSDGQWGTMDGTTFTTLGSNLTLFANIGADAYQFWRVRGAVASGSVATVNYSISW